VLKLVFRVRTQWTSPGMEDRSEPHFEALSKASGLTPPRWP